VELKEKIIQEALKWADMKVPYLHRGTTVHGCDCTGLLLGILQNLGYLTKYHLPMYPPDWNLHSGGKNDLLKNLSECSYEIPKNSAQPGDIILFSLGKCRAHAGILITNTLFVHSHAGVGCIRSTLKTSRWFKRLTGAMRLDETKLK